MHAFRRGAQHRPEWFVCNPSRHRFQAIGVYVGTLPCVQQPCECPAMHRPEVPGYAPPWPASRSGLDHLPVPMKAGEVLFFKAALIHCSPVNKGNEVRVAIRIEILAKERKMIIYYQDERSEHTVGTYEIGKDFFTTYVKGQEPDAPKIDSFEHVPPAFSKSKLKAHLGKGRFVWMP